MKTLLKFILLATLIVSCNNDDRIPDPKTCEMEFEDLGFDSDTYLGSYGWKLIGDTLKINYGSLGYSPHGDDAEAQNHLFKIDFLNNCIQHIESHYKQFLIYEKNDTIYINETEYDIVTSFPHYYNVERNFEELPIKIQNFEIGDWFGLELQLPQLDPIYPYQGSDGFFLYINKRLGLKFLEDNLFDDYEAIWNELP